MFGALRLARWSLGTGVSALTVGLLVVGTGATPPALAQNKKVADKKPLEKLDLNELSLEVSALQAMNTLKLRPVQLKAVLAMSRAAGQKSRKRDEPDASGKYRKTLLALREALISGQEDLSADLSDQLEQLRKDEDPDIDDEVDITDEARKQAPKLLALLTAPQVASHIAGYGDNTPDPLQLLSKTMKLNGGKRTPPAQWKEERDLVAREVSALLTTDPAQMKKLHDQIAKLLDRAYAVKPPLMKKERPDLLAAARQIIGNVGPFDVLRNMVENDLAELLSNPRTPAAVEARMAAPKPAP
jgi:hypothetical protein